MNLTQNVPKVKGQTEASQLDLGKDIEELGGSHLVELVIGARFGVAIGTPAHHFAGMTQAHSRKGAVADLDHPLAT